MGPALQATVRHRTLRLIGADTVALALYSLLTGIFCIVLEIALLGYSLQQWAGVRLLFNGLRYPGARLLGVLTDRLRVFLGGNHRHFLRRSFAATAALSVYHMPIYLFSASVMGVPLRQILIALPIYFAQGMLFGWLYGYCLDAVRRWFHANAAEAQ